jgi:hypothetical protein
MPLAGNTVLSVALTPTARSAAVDVTEESYDVSAALLAQYNQTTLAVGDFVAVSTPVVDNTHVGVVGARVVDATHIAIQWGNFTAAANVPPAGTYRFLIQKA